jgi:DNA-binding PadR family transcriptional regulator
VTPSRRKRRVYTLTPAGEDELSLLSEIIRKRMDFLMRPLLELIDQSTKS